MTYFYFYDQNAKHLTDYAKDLIGLAWDELIGLLPFSSVMDYLNTVSEKRKEIAAAETLLNAMEEAAAGRPAALLKLADQSEIDQVKAWSVYVRRMLSEKQMVLGY